VAAGLYERGIRPGAVVSWQLPTSIDTAVLLAALSRLGVTQNPVLPILREREVRHIARESQAGVFIVRPVWRGYDYEQLATGISSEIGFSVLATDTLPQADPGILPDPPGKKRSSDGSSTRRFDCGSKGVAPDARPWRDERVPGRRAPTTTDMMPMRSRSRTSAGSA
jgi:acyl-CoA synthetase (AMP-forming)/AMP-acid ligase II